MTDERLLYCIALAGMPGIGDISARRLLSWFDDISQVFTESYRGLMRVPGIGSRLAEQIINHRSLEAARYELEFIRRHQIGTLFITEENYPARLKECPDAPVLIYYKGKLHAGTEKLISVVGTRSITRRGKEITEEIISGLADRFDDLVIVSGLAYGVDINAHRAALKNKIPTIGILAHGFSTLYPSAHARTAREMLEEGALITDFASSVKPDRNNFLKRNRIIAGYSDATLVIESGVKGGAMVTADIAMSYNREVFAVPGYPGEKYSAGCNMLIKSQKAFLVESVDDIAYFMSWSSKDQLAERQQKINFETGIPEKNILRILSSEEQMNIEKIAVISGLKEYQVTPVLLRLEFAGLVASRPGNIYRILPGGLSAINT